MLFFLDEMFSEAIAELGRRDYGLDIVSSHASERNGLPDEVQLLLAAQDGRCLVTKNDKDFRLWTERFQAARLAHVGVLVPVRRLPSSRFAAIARALSYYAAVHADGMAPYMLDYLQPAPDDWAPTSNSSQPA